MSIISAHDLSLHSNSISISDPTVPVVTGTLQSITSAEEHPKTPPGSLRGNQPSPTSGTMPFNDADQGEEEEEEEETEDQGTYIVLHFHSCGGKKVLVLNV